MTAPPSPSTQSPVDSSNDRRGPRRGHLVLFWNLVFRGLRTLGTHGRSFYTAVGIFLIIGVLVGIAGTIGFAALAEVVREGYPDVTALDPTHANHDPDATPDDPRWYMVDLEAVARLARPVTLAEIKACPDLAEMALVRVGRLSVTPVTPAEWATIDAMGSEPGR